MYYVLSREFFRCLLTIIAGLRVIGGENVPETGGVILAPNHLSYLDPPVCGMGMKRHARFMAKEELFRPPLGYWVRAVGFFSCPSRYCRPKSYQDRSGLPGEG